MKSLMIGWSGVSVCLVFFFVGVMIWSYGLLADPLNMSPDRYASLSNADTIRLRKVSKSMEDWRFMGSALASFALAVFIVVAYVSVRLRQHAGEQAEAEAKS